MRKHTLTVWVWAAVLALGLGYLITHAVDQLKASTKTDRPMMDPRPGELFYYTFWYGFDSPPKIDRSSITDYAGLILEFAYSRARLDDKGRLIYNEIWKRHRQTVQDDMVINGMKVRDIPVEIEGRDAKKQKPRFFKKHSETGEYEEIEYAQTEGESEYLMIRYYGYPDDSAPNGQGLLKGADIVKQTLDGRVEYIYDGDARRSTYEIRHLRRDNFERTVYP